MILQMMEGIHIRKKYRLLSKKLMLFFVAVAVFFGSWSLLSQTKVFGQVPPPGTTLCLVVPIVCEGGPLAGETKTLTVIVENRDSITPGTVTSDVGGIVCSNTSSPCTATYSKGTDVTLTPNPTGDVVWSGSGCSGSGLCQVKMDDNRTVTAKFQAISQMCKTVDQIIKPDGNPRPQTPGTKIAYPGDTIKYKIIYKAAPGTGIGFQLLAPCV